MSLTMLYGKEYLEKGLIPYEQILLSTESDTEYFQRLQVRKSWRKNCSYHLNANEIARKKCFDLHSDRR